MIMTLLLAGAAISGAQPTQTVIAPDKPVSRSAPSDRVDPAAMINQAAAMVGQGDIAAAKKVYRQLEAMPSGYTLETTDGRWLYPAEIARRSMKQLDQAGGTTRMAARD